MTRTKLFLIILVIAGGLGVAPARALTDVPGCDFNGDGNADIAVGVPRENLGGVRNTGAVHVVYGSDGGITVVGNQLLHQDKPGIPGSNEEADRFGEHVACGDFDDDGDDELVVGTPLEDVGAVINAGAVTVIPGSPEGLTSTGARMITQRTDGVVTTPAQQERFGAALGVGDFDADGNDDLAIGVPRQDVHDLEDREDAGAVHVLYGDERGLTTEGAEYLHEAVEGKDGTAETGDQFGRTLAAGDFDGDGNDDLAIGVPREDVWTGAVHIVRGDAAGTTLSGQQVITEQNGPLEDESNVGDRFGWSLEAGNFNGDARDDLAIGAPRDREGRGAVHVLDGGDSGLATTPADEITESSGRRFGFALTSGDFDGDADDDLAIGRSSGETVTVVDGGTWSQDTEGIKGSTEMEDQFGSALASGDLDGDGRGDLIVGVWGEEIRGTADAGAVNVIFGSATGLSIRGDRVLHQDIDGMKNSAERGDRFGWSLA